MVTGHLRQRKGYYYIVITYYDSSKKRKTKIIGTGFIVHGNKKRAEKMLLKSRKNFIIPE